MTARLVLRCTPALMPSAPSPLDALDRHLRAGDRPAALDAARALFARLAVEDVALGYAAATVLHRWNLGRAVISDLIREAWWENRVKIPAAIARSFPVYLRTINEGPPYGVNPRCFAEARPVLAYCDDVGAGVDDLQGLREVGRTRFFAEPFMWLQGERACVLLQVDGPGEVSFRSRGRGEFCLEVHHARPDGTFVAIVRDDFCLK